LKFVPDELVGAGVSDLVVELGALVSATIGAPVAGFEGVSVVGNRVGLAVNVIGDCVGLEVAVMLVGARVISHDSTLFPNKSARPLHPSEMTLLGHENKTPLVSLALQPTVVTSHPHSQPFMDALKHL
jgi:hypothetical protein